MSRLASAILLIILLSALAGCGQKGPLVRPNSTAAPASAHSAPPLPSDPTSPIPDDGGS